MANPRTSEPRYALVVDDEPFARELVKRVLEANGWSVREAASCLEAQRFLTGPTAPSVILLDILLGGENGLDFLDLYGASGGTVPVIVMTSLDDVDTAVKAMRGGAYDFLVKPVSKDRLLTAVGNAAERLALVRENRSLRQRIREDALFKTLIGESAAMKNLFAELEQVVESDISVCLMGETGSGKELAARWLHENGPRAKGPFVDLNCAAIPETLIESELFGHERGAFTGAIQRHRGKLEQADAGTLLLDELGEMSAATQARLLRVLQERTVVRVGGSERVPFNLRLISATQRDLDEAVRDGRFREDLFFRVVVYPVRLPPLRKRKEDLPLLAHHFINKFRAVTGRPVEGITPAALDRLAEHDWPGNVRELENVIHRAVVASRGHLLTPNEFPEVRGTGRAFSTASLAAPAPEVVRPPEQPQSTPADGPGYVLSQDLVTMEDYERVAITKSLSAVHGNIRAAADRLQVARSTLYRRVRELGIALTG